MKAEDAIARLDGTLCGFRSTSCPDQIAKNLKKALEEMKLKSTGEPLHRTLCGGSLFARGRF